MEYQKSVGKKEYQVFNEMLGSAEKMEQRKYIAEGKKRVTTLAYDTHHTKT